MARILITGGTGFIGYHIAKKYLDLGFEVYLIDNLSRGRIDKNLKNLFKNRKLVFKKIDLCKSKININRNFKYIFHCAAIIGVKHVLKKPYEVLIKNLAMLENIINYAKNQKKLERFIFFSTSEVYAETLKKKLITFPTPESSKILIDEKYNSRSTYMLSKLYGEYITYFSKLPITIFRPHNFYGPRMGMSHVIPELAQKITKKKRIELYSYNHSRTFCFIDDAVNEIYLIIKTKKSLNQLYNIGSQEEIKIYDLAKKIAENLNKKNIKLIKKKDINNSPIKRLPSTKKAKKISKYRFEHNIDRGLKITIDWYIKNYFSVKNKEKTI